MRTRYTVFGLQRSGTNFLEQHIITGMPNCRMITAYAHDGLWKHTYDINHDIKTMRAKNTSGLETYDYWIARLRETNAIWIHKHPFTWIDSIRRKNMDCKHHPDYDGTGNKLGPRVYDGTLLSLCNIYKNHQAFWIEQSRHQSIYRLSYESLLPPGNGLMHTRMIAEFFNDDDFRPFERTFNKVPISSKFSDDDRNKYIKYETTLSDEDKEFVIKNIGMKAIEYYGYRI